MTSEGIAMRPPTLLRPWWGLVLLGLLAASLSITAQRASPGADAVRYVREGATGDATGLDWTNAFPSLPPVLTRGYTYYVADGRYPTYAFATPDIGDGAIVVRKATNIEHGTALDWHPTYGDGTASWGRVTFTTSHWVFDGATGGGPGSWTTGYGFTFTETACAQGNFVTTSDGVSDITLRHISFTQDGNTEACRNASANATNGIYTASGGEGSIYDSLFEYLYFENLAGLPFFMRGGSRNTIQFTYTGNICGKYVSDVNAHCAMTVVHGMTDMHFRYNYVAESPSSGAFVKNDYEPSHRIYIYGNVIRDGLPVACNTGPCNHWRILNNTFTDLATGPVAGSGSILETSAIYNNLAFGGSAISFATAANRSSYDYTWYSRLVRVACRMLAAPHDNVVPAYAGNCDAVLESRDPFVNSKGRTPDDFQLAAPIEGYDGVDVCTLVACAADVLAFSRDAFGRRRGGDGRWERGAFEFQAVGRPSGLRIVPD